MRLRRIAIAGVALGLAGVVVRSEGRAVGRVLLGVSDARVSEAAGVAEASSGRGPAAAVARWAVGLWRQPALRPGTEVRI